MASVDEQRAELAAYQALVRVIMTFAGTQQDDTARRVYATIARFNLGEMFRPGGSGDQFLLPYELFDQDTA